MDLNSRTLVEVAATAGVVSSLAYFALCAAGIASFLNRRRKNLRMPPLAANQLPPISILKPLKGIDPDIWQSFCSHCEQDYPRYQLVFGISDPQDPAIELVRRLQQKYPDRDIELVVCERTLGTNTKVSTLAQMLPAARYDVLLVNDSDIRVAPGYLRRVATVLADNSVGLVTCLYRGVAGGTAGSRLEAMGISTDFVPGVLSARFLESGLRFALGSTLAFCRADLEAIGGFEALLDYLADDYELGRRIAALGKRVEMSDMVVETFLPPYSPGQFLEHQMRWSRTIRDARRWGYIGVLLTFGLLWALIMLVAAQEAPWAWALFGVTVAARLVIALVSALTVLGDRQVLRDFVLLPVRDLLAPLLWLSSFAGNRISWRGDLFHLKDGRLARIPRAAGQQ